MLKITKAEALKYHKIFQKALEALTDEDALQIPMLYEPWKPNTQYTLGKRVQYNNILYSVLLAHTSQETWTPDVSPSLFARVLIPDPTVIPEWIQPTGSTDAYMIGDKVSHNGKNWINTFDYNTYEPGVYGWNEI